MNQLCELAMVNDDIMALDEARVSIHDGGVYFGDGVYEVLRLCNRRLFAREAHLERFGYSLGEMGMLDKVDIDVINPRVDRAVAASSLSDATLYFHVTRSRKQRNLVIEENWQPQFLLTLRQTPARQRETIKMISLADERWKRCDIKSLNLLANVMAKQKARRQGDDDALLVDEQGQVTESTSSSVMLVKEGKLRTAPLSANILASVTRRYVLEWAGSLGLEVCEQSFTLEQACAADELFVVGTSSEVLAITTLDGRAIGNQCKGAFAAAFHQRLRDAMEHE